MLCCLSASSLDETPNALTVASINIRAAYPATAARAPCHNLVHVAGAVSKRAPTNEEIRPADAPSTWPTICGERTSAAHRASHRFRYAHDNERLRTSRFSGISSGLSGFRGQPPVDESFPLST